MTLHTAAEVQQANAGQFTFCGKAYTGWVVGQEMILDVGCLAGETLYHNVWVDGTVMYLTGATDSSPTNRGSTDSPAIYYKM